MSRILLVEDETLLRMDLARQLQRAGYQVIACDSADQAQYFLSNKSVDLLLTDLKMPGTMDGRELVHHVAGRADRPKIAVVSAYFEETGNLQVDAVFKKPVRVAQLLKEVRRLLQ